VAIAIAALASAVGMVTTTGCGFIGMSPDAPALRGLPALAPRCRGQRTVLCEAAMFRLDGATALAPSFSRQGSVLCEAAFFVRDVGPALASDLALLALFHTGKAARRRDSVALLLVSHACSPACSDPTR
jgi:hypothetical protein